MGSLAVPRLKAHRQAIFAGSPDAVIMKHLHGTPRV